MPVPKGRHDGPTQRDIARRLDLDVSTVNKILRNARGPTFSRETVRRVRQMAERLGYDRGRLRHQHRRDHHRRVGKEHVVVNVYHPDGLLVDQGKATLVEISRSGARLDHVRLPTRSLPLGGFDIGIEIRDGLQGELRGRLARAFQVRSGNSVAILFKTALSDLQLNSFHRFAPG